MLYSIGYERITVSQLIAILKEYNIEYLIDVRSKPFSSKPGFGKIELRKEVNHNEIEYHWLGETLGGFGEIADDALIGLVNMSKRHVVCIMCMEHYPKSCHRYTEIGARLDWDPFNVEVIHLLPVLDTDGNYIKCNQQLTGSQSKLF